VVFAKFTAQKIEKWGPTKHSWAVFSVFPKKLAFLSKKGEFLVLNSNPFKRILACARMTPLETVCPNP
jgi:hypothetical protein